MLVCVRCSVYVLVLLCSGLNLVLMIVVGVMFVIFGVVSGFVSGDV